MIGSSSSLNFHSANTKKRKVKGFLILVKAKQQNFSASGKVRKRKKKKKKRKKVNKKRNDFEI